METFSIGEKVAIVDESPVPFIYIKRPGEIQTITSAACEDYPATEWCRMCGLSDVGHFTDVQDGLKSWTPIEFLRKLPPDSRASTRDTSEDPGLTRLKKLLEQDRHKQPVKEKAP